MTQKEIHTRAGKVNDISLDYHLTHAVFACDKLLEDSFKEAGKKEIDRFNNALKKACREKNDDIVAKLIKEKKSLKLVKYHIFVDYIDMDDPNAGRVIKAENKLIISLPRKLLDQTKGENGAFIPDGIENLRKVMAHELGHIALHTDKLLFIDNMIGSNQLDGEQEQEANWFATELLRLRHERNEKLAKLRA